MASAIGRLFPESSLAANERMGRHSAVQWGIQRLAFEPTLIYQPCKLPLQTPLAFPGTNVLDNAVRESHIVALVGKRQRASIPNKHLDAVLRKTSPVPRTRIDIQCVNSAEHWRVLRPKAGISAYIKKTLVALRRQSSNKQRKALAPPDLEYLIVNGKN